MLPRLPARVVGFGGFLCQADRSQRFDERRLPELDVRKPRLFVEIEEPVEVRAGEICVDEDDTASGAGQGDGEIGGGRRLSLGVDGARDHDRWQPWSAFARSRLAAEGAELLRLAACRVGEHDEAVVLSKTRRGRRGKRPSRRQAEDFADGVDRPDSRVEGIREKHDDECKDEAEAEGDQAVPRRARADLGRFVGGLGRRAPMALSADGELLAGTR